MIQQIPHVNQGQFSWQQTTEQCNFLNEDNPRITRVQDTLKIYLCELGLKHPPDVLLGRDTLSMAVIMMIIIINQNFNNNNMRLLASKSSCINTVKVT